LKDTINLMNEKAQPDEVLNYKEKKLEKRFKIARYVIFGTILALSIPMITSLI
jgi:hypothetical protein